MANDRRGERSAFFRGFLVCQSAIVRVGADYRGFVTIGVLNQNLRVTQSSGSRNRPRALAVVIWANSAGERPRISASRAAVKADAGWLVGLTAAGVWAEIRTVRFDQEPVERNAGGHVAQRVQALVRERHHPGERQVQTQLQARLCIVPRSGERVHDSSDGTIQPMQLLDDVALAVAAWMTTGKSCSWARPRWRSNHSCCSGTACGPSIGLIRSRRRRRRRAVGRGR